MREVRPGHLGRFFVIVLVSTFLFVLFLTDSDSLLQSFNSLIEKEPHAGDKAHLPLELVDSKNNSDSVTLSNLQTRLTGRTTSSSVNAISLNKQDELYHAGDRCRVNVKVLVANEALSASTLTLTHDFSESKMGALPICFQRPELSAELGHICRAKGKGPIQCDMLALAEKQAKSSAQAAITPFTHLMVVVEQGAANTRGGLMALDAHDDLAVLQHEVAHWLGYVDEYRVSLAQQKTLCKEGPITWLGPNVLSAPSNMPLAEVEAFAKRPLYASRTCDGTERKAYKTRADAGFMEYLDYSVTNEEVENIAQRMQAYRPIPVAMNFALAFEVFDHQVLSPQQKASNERLYEYWLKQAAKQGVPDAHIRLARWNLKSNELDKVHQYLKQAAELGNAQAQLILGHAYLEGRWWPKDHGQSAFWYQQAAKQNVAAGLYYYGQCFEFGRGCVESLVTAQDYYRQASAMGYEEAKTRLP